MGDPGAITYGGPDDAIAFRGYHQASTGAGILPAAIYASDGGRPYPVCCQDKLADRTDGNGIEGVWGPTASGHLIADLRSIYPDSEGINRVCHILQNRLEFARMIVRNHPLAIVPGTLPIRRLISGFGCRPCPEEPAE